MKKKAQSLLIASLIVIAACKNHKETTKAPETSAAKVETETTTPPVTKATEPAPVDSSNADNYRLTVVFFSIGMGTDGPNLLKFEESIGKYAGEIGKTIDYERTNWGREGETDFCLRLNELNASQQAEFVARTKELLKTAKWVNIYENRPCQHKRKR